MRWRHPVRVWQCEWSAGGVWSVDTACLSLNGVVWLAIVLVVCLCTGLAGSGSTGLDAMARCYPVEQLSEYLSDGGQTHKTHRRCRGGLLSMMRHILAISQTPSVRVRAAVCSAACHSVTHIFDRYMCNTTCHGTSTRDVCEGAGCGRPCVADTTCATNTHGAHVATAACVTTNCRRPCAATYMLPLPNRLRCRWSVRRCRRRHPAVCPPPRRRFPILTTTAHQLATLPLPPPPPLQPQLAPLDKPTCTLHMALLVACRYPCRRSSPPFPAPSAAATSPTTCSRCPLATSTTAWTPRRRRSVGF